MAWLFPTLKPLPAFQGDGRTSSKSRHRGWVSYLPAYLPAVPHVWHQWLVWWFGRLWDGDARGVLWKEGERGHKEEGGKSMNGEMEGMKPKGNKQTRARFRE